MCRFTVSQQPGVDVKNEIDGFNWFDAIEEYECSDHEDQADDEQQDCTLANGGLGLAYPFTTRLSAAAEQLTTRAICRWYTGPVVQADRQ